MSIATLVQNCLKEFSSLQVRNSQGDLEEVIGRFKIWKSNIGAHKRGTASLDYRLRDATHIRELVFELLNSILEGISDAQEISDREVRLKDDSEMEEAELPIDAELQQIVLLLSDCTTYLLRLSVAISHPAPYDRFMGSGDIDISSYEPYDITHVQQKYPEAEDFLLARMGRVISSRRLYLRYREQHHDRLAREFEDDDQTVASNLPSKLEDIAMTDVEESRRSEDELSTTSYATTKPDQGTCLSVPRMPDASQSGDPIECPVCFTMIIIENKKEWKKHVFTDLQPYVCLIRGCITPNRLYSKRRDWISHHESHAQRIEELSCPLCHDSFDDVDRLYKHVAQHQEQLALFALPLSASDASNETPAAEATNASDKTPAAEATLIIPDFGSSRHEVWTCCNCSNGYQLAAVCEACSRCGHPRCYECASEPVK